MLKKIGERAPFKTGTVRCRNTGTVEIARVQELRRRRLTGPQLGRLYLCSLSLGDSDTADGDTTGRLVYAVL